MTEPLIVKSSDPILGKLHFRPFRATTERRVKQFLPAVDEPQTIQLTTRRGLTLTARSGDMLLSEMDTPQYVWPVARDIFEGSYEIIRPGVCVKRAITWLVPLTELTGGNPDRQVTVVSLEGSSTVRAGDYYLAKGISGEIWPYAREKVGTVMKPVEE